jgi:LVIVD repeat
MSPPRLSLFVCAGMLLASCGGSSSSDSSSSGSSGPLAPLIDPKAVAPEGDPLCSALSPDQKLAFVGEGGSLALLDVDSITGDGSICLKARLPLDVACFSLCTAGESIFLCGGKLGLYEVVTCPALSASCATACDSYPLHAIDKVDQKLCIAAAAVHDPIAGDFLLVLYSAKDDSELRVYDLASPHLLRGVADLPGASGSQGFAIAAGDQTPHLAYVALGRGGIVRIDITDLAHIGVESGPIFDQPDQVLFGQPATAVDVVQASGFLYAAIDSGGLVEIDLSQAWSMDMPYTYRVLGCGDNTVAYAYRAAALTDPSGRILVAVGTHVSPAQQIDGGPFSLAGSWDFKLGLGNVPDAKPGGPAGCPAQIFIFARVPATTPPGSGSTCPPGELCQIASLPNSTDEWRSLALRPSGSNYQVCECRRTSFRVVDLGPNPFSRDALTYNLLGVHTSTGLAPIDGVVSDVNSSLLYLSNDSAGSIFAGMSKIGAGDATLGIVPDTSGLCTQSTVPPVYCDTSDPASDLPAPYRSGLFSTAHWVDSDDPSREWFVSGQTGTYDQCASPCNYSDQWCESIWHSPASTSLPTPGWKVVSFLPDVQDGTQWQLRWWQIAAPSDPDGNAGRNYLGSLSDSRPDHPTLLHLTRAGIAGGYIVCDRDGLQAAAESLCSTNNGRGQEVQAPWMHVLSTHLEFASLSSNCTPPEALALTTACRVYSVDVNGETRWVSVLSAGYPANPCAPGIWDPFYQRAMLVFYDVTNVDADTPPQLLRLAFGPAGAQGNAFALETDEIDGRDYAFVADMGGRLLVFDVSADKLFPPPGDPSDPTTGLSPFAVWTCPLNPFDGFRDNVINVAVDPPRVYLATGRRGLTILDFDPTTHALQEIQPSPVPTPGLVLGLILRRVGSSTTLVVGDSRAGLRLYGRPGS